MAGERTTWAKGGGRSDTPLERERIRGLLWRDPAMLLAPIENEALIALVESGEIAAEPTNYTWQGRRGIRFWMIPTSTARPAPSSTETTR